MNHTPPHHHHHGHDTKMVTHKCNTLLCKFYYAYNGRLVVVSSHTLIKPKKKTTEQEIYIKGFFFFFSPVVRQRAKTGVLVACVCVAFILWYFSRKPTTTAKKDAQETESGARARAKNSHFVMNAHAPTTYYRFFCFSPFLTARPKTPTHTHDCVHLTSHRSYAPPHTWWCRSASRVLSALCVYTRNLPHCTEKTTHTVILTTNIYFSFKFV